MKIHRVEKSRKHGFVIITEQNHDFQSFDGCDIFVAKAAMPSVRKILRYCSPRELERQWGYARHVIIRLRRTLGIPLEKVKGKIDPLCVSASPICNEYERTALIITPSPILFETIGNMRLAIERSLLPRFILFLRHASPVASSIVTTMSERNTFRARHAIGAPVRRWRKRIIHRQTLSSIAAARLLDQLAEIEGCDIDF